MFTAQLFLAARPCANQTSEGRPSNLLVCVNKTDQQSWHIPWTQDSQYKSMLWLTTKHYNPKSIL
jgi:hypothetical protein